MRVRHGEGAAPDRTLVGSYLLVGQFRRRSGRHAVREGVADDLTVRVQYREAGLERTSRESLAGPILDLFGRLRLEVRRRTAVELLVFKHIHKRCLTFCEWVLWFRFACLALESAEHERSAGESVADRKSHQLSSLLFTTRVLP